MPKDSLPVTETDTGSGLNDKCSELSDQVADLRNEIDAVLVSIVDPFLIVDREWRVSFANQEAVDLLSMLHHSVKEVTGKVLWEEFPDMAGMMGGQELRRAMGENTTVQYEEFYPHLNKWFDIKACPFSRGLSICARDVTESVRLREELRVMSVHDELTGLGNRRGFFTLAHQQLKIADRTKKRAFLFCADFDQLKNVNDTFGHLEGDWALTETANLLKNTFRESDIIARLGGDEFAILMTEASEASEELIRTRLQKNIDAYNNRRRRPYAISLAIGMAVYDPNSPKSLDELLVEADCQLRRSKQARANNGSDAGGR